MRLPVRFRGANRRDALCSRDVHAAFPFLAGLIGGSGLFHVKHASGYEAVNSDSEVVLGLTRDDEPCVSTTKVSHYLFVVACQIWSKSVCVIRFIIGCTQHVMVTLCGPVIILYGLIPVTLVAWSISFSSAACIILVGG